MSDSRVPRALVVEDDPAWQAILTEILIDSGLIVDVADHLAHAVAELRRVPHRLAIVDLALEANGAANHDGLKVLEAVRRQDPRCVSILLTGYATVELAVDALTDYGAFSCLRKSSFDRKAFRDLVDKALSSALPLREDGAGGCGPYESVWDGASDVDVHPALNSVLVVEDDAGWRSILSELLSDAGYQVRLCNSYGEAVGCLRREHYRMAVVDLSLDGGAWGARQRSSETLDGYQLLELTQQRNIPTIVVSGVAMSENVEHTYQAYGVAAYLEKQTFSRRAFLQSLAEVREVSDVNDELDTLTPREMDVLTLLTQGMTNKAIADSLFISTNTVKRHLKAVFDKLDVHTRAAAAAKASGAGVHPDSGNNATA